jgi:hypothetical protein
VPGSHSIIYFVYPGCCFIFVNVIVICKEKKKNLGLSIPFRIVWLSLLFFLLAIILMVPGTETWIVAKNAGYVHACMIHVVVTHGYPCASSTLFF